MEICERVCREALAKYARALFRINMAGPGRKKMGGGLVEVGKAGGVGVGGGGE